MFSRKHHATAGLMAVTLLASGAALHAAPTRAPQSATLASVSVTYKPYIQPGDAGALGATDQMVIAWQTDEKTPNPGAYTVQYGPTMMVGSSAAPGGRVVDNYLAADPSLPIPATAYGAHTDYTAVLKGLAYDTTYYYTVTGPGLPAGGFASTFHTRPKTGQFSFEIMGDEGFFPSVPASNPARIVNYEARIINEMYGVSSLDLSKYNLPPQSLPTPYFAINTGDNVYNTGSEDNYRDFWMNVWNNDAASNETGAPFIRSIPYYIVAGNHDTGGNGDRANLLGGNAGRFSGGVGGGDALAYFNNYYYPLNGPTGVDQQFTFNGDAYTLDGLYLTDNENNTSYTSPIAIQAYRDSTLVDGGQGAKRQFDHMNNYSFDSGNVHFTFLDSNPHLFADKVNYDATFAQSPNRDVDIFPEYPSVLRAWLINDLDSTRQPWKIVIYHHPAFSSGNATLRNHQMRKIAKLLEDHGVNLVFNGHEHNYQRTLPLRALPGVGDALSTANPPVVAVDTAFDGINQTVPDGVLHFVEGAGGNKDFDDNLPNPRGGGAGIDQDDSMGGTMTNPSTTGGQSYPNGPASWLDTHLTNTAMTPFLANAGAGPKITTKFKSHIFSFADILVNNNALTLYQISEPLSSRFSGTYGTDISGTRINDAIADTQIDPATGQVTTPAQTGTPALLDKLTVTRPDITNSLTARLFAPPSAVAGGLIVYTVSVANNSPYGLNGAQAIVTLPATVAFAGTTSDTLTQQGSDIVVTLGRLAPGQRGTVQVKGRVSAGASSGTVLTGAAVFRSSTALPLALNTTSTQVITAPPPPRHP